MLITEVNKRFKNAVSIDDYSEVLELIETMLPEAVRQAEEADDHYWELVDVAPLQEQYAASDKAIKLQRIADRLHKLENRCMEAIDDLEEEANNIRIEQENREYEIWFNSSDE